MREKEKGQLATPALGPLKMTMLHLNTVAQAQLPGASIWCYTFAYNMQCCNIGGISGVNASRATDSPRNNGAQGGQSAQSA